MIGGIRGILFSIYSHTWKYERSKSFLGEPLKHVITVRGQILVSRTDDDPLPPVCVHSKRPRVWIQNIPVCTGTTRTCFNTCARGASIHGDVLNVHTEAFLKPNTGFSTFFSVPQLTHTHQTHTTTNNTTTTQHNTQHHTETETERDRERQRETEREKDRERQRKTRQDKTRQDKTRQDKTRQDKTRQDKTRQDKTRQEKRREEKRREEKRRQEKRQDEEERGKVKEKMKRDRDEKMFFSEKCLRTLKSARWIRPTCFEKKKRTVGRIIPPFFLRKFRIWPCFQLFTWFEFDFSGPMN